MEYSTLTTSCRQKFWLQTPLPALFSPGSLLLQVIRLSFWFACFWAVVGTVWRPLLSSVGLLFIFLVLLASIERLSRWLNSTKLPLFQMPGTEAAEPGDETLRQQIIRTQTAEGLDRLDGTFCVEFPADAMTATVHIPFCPAFESVPKVQVFPVEATDVSLRVAVPKMFGVRVDVKRNDPAIDRLRFAVIAEG